MPASRCASVDGQRRGLLRQRTLQTILRHIGVRTDRPGNFSTPQEARLTVFDFIEDFYSPRRRHAALDLLSTHTAPYKRCSTVGKFYQQHHGQYCALRDPRPDFHQTDAPWISAHPYPPSSSSQYSPNRRLTKTNFRPLRRGQWECRPTLARCRAMLRCS